MTGIGLIGLLTHVVNTSDIAPELAVMIGLGVGIDYALFIVTRFREAYARRGHVDDAVLEAMDTSGRAVVLVAAASPAGVRRTWAPEPPAGAAGRS